LRRKEELEADVSEVGKASKGSFRSREAQRAYKGDPAGTGGEERKKTGLQGRGKAQVLTKKGGRYKSVSFKKERTEVGAYRRGGKGGSGNVWQKEERRAGPRSKDYLAIRGAAMRPLRQGRGREKVLGTGTETGKTES